MALIKCPECGREVSDQATSCPGCGHPLHDVTTIEATGKKWKSIQIWSWLSIVGGIILLLIGALTTAGWVIICGAIAFIGGAFGLIYASLGIWWHHR